MSEDEEFQKHHLPKPCQFCSNMAGYAPLDEMEKHNVGVYYCHTCKAEYLFFRDARMASVSLYTAIKDKMYRWTVTSVGSAQLWYVSVPGIPGVKKNEGLVPIKSWDTSRGDTLPQLTPDNINEKLRTWLLFL